MSAITIPTSGVARRRAKAIRNRLAVAASVERIAFPPSVVVGCSCGWLGWLGPDSTDEDRDRLDQQAAEHDYLCSEVQA